MNLLNKVPTNLTSEQLLNLVNGASRKERDTNGVAHYMADQRQLQRGLAYKNKPWTKSTLGQTTDTYGNTYTPYTNQWGSVAYVKDSKPKLVSKPNYEPVIQVQNRQFRRLWDPDGAAGNTLSVLQLLPGVGGGRQGAAQLGNSLYSAIASEGLTPEEQRGLWRDVATLPLSILPFGSALGKGVLKFAPKASKAAVAAKTAAINTAQKGTAGRVASQLIINPKAQTAPTLIGHSVIAPTQTATDLIRDSQQPIAENTTQEQLQKQVKAQQVQQQAIKNGLVTTTKPLSPRMQASKLSEYEQFRQNARHKYDANGRQYTQKMYDAGVKLKRQDDGSFIIWDGQ